LRGEALRCLLYLFERDEALPLMGAVEISAPSFRGDAPASNSDVLLHIRVRASRAPE
jgi:hypothetical protein